MRPAPLLPLFVLVSACDGWPLHASLPDPGELVPAGGVPGDVPAVTRTQVPDVDADQPPGRELPAPLGIGRGVVLSGTLDGGGWWDDAAPRLLVGDACDSEGARSPGGGDWVGDVDVAHLALDEAGRLCVTLSARGDDVGLDAIVTALDACGVPTGFLGGDPPLGFGGRAPSVRWSQVVDAGRYSLLVAAYLPDDADLALPWRAQVDLVPDDAFCPALEAAP